MKILLQNLGPIKKANFSIGDITIICGDNNTGKTYATYAFYGFLKFWRDMYTIPVEKSMVEELFAIGSTQIQLEEFISRRNLILQKASQEYCNSLSTTVFAGASRNFADARFEIKLEEPMTCPSISFSRGYGSAKKQLFTIHKEADENVLEVTLLHQEGVEEISRDAVIRTIGNAIQEILFGHLFPKVFIASAERTGAAIFRNELNFARNRLLEEVSKMDKAINPFALLEKSYGNYPLAVEDNVEYTRNLEEIAKKDSYITKNHPDVLKTFENIIGGKYDITSNEELFYVPISKKVKLLLKESSSAVRSMVDIGFYLRHEAAQGDLLMIDEPELNLHPKNQRRIARLFAQLANIGIKVFITTHSDYIIKELNTLIMLNKEVKHHKQIMEKEGYSEYELLTSEQVKVFIAERALVKLDGKSKRSKHQTLTQATITNQYGIEVSSFDTTIDEMNRIQEDIVWGEVD